MSASPESLSRMRLKAGSVTPPRPGSGRSGGSRRSPGAGRDLGAQLAEGLAAVLLLVHVRLLEQDHVLEPLLQPALDDLLLDVLGLALGGRLLAQHAQLGLSACSSTSSSDT